MLLNGAAARLVYSEGFRDFINNLIIETCWSQTCQVGGRSKDWPTIPTAVQARQIQAWYRVTWETVDTWIEAVKDNGKAELAALHQRIGNSYATRPFAKCHELNKQILNPAAVPQRFRSGSAAVRYADTLLARPE